MRLRNLLLLPLLLAPIVAQAHPAPFAHVHGFVDGFAHPWTGIDHMLAMFAVGLWASQRGGRAMWLVPTTFVIVMAAAGFAASEGMIVPLPNQGVAVSVLALGVLIASAARMPIAITAGVVALFAIFHGYAHGVDMPADVSGFAYGVGFVVATASLHLLGIASGTLARGRASRTLGALIAMSGVWLCVAA